MSKCGLQHGASVYVKVDTLLQHQIRRVFFSKLSRDDRLSHHISHSADNWLALKKKKIRAMQSRAV